MPARRGLTFVELLVGMSLLTIALMALFGVFTGTSTLNEHARDRAWAMDDANRVMERLRQQNAGCNQPAAASPAGFGNWDAWLASSAAAGGGGKTLQPNPNVNELVTLSASGTDPLGVTVSICWRSRNRVYGECRWTGTQLAASDANGDGIISSPAMLFTLITCRS